MINSSIYPEIVNKYTCTRNVVPTESYTIYAQAPSEAREQMEEKYPNEVSQGFTVKRVKTVKLKELVKQADEFIVPDDFDDPLPEYILDAFEGK